MKFPLHSRIVLSQDIPDARLCRGDIATVIEYYDTPGVEPGYEIEVFDATGNRIAMEKSFDDVGHGGRYVLVGVVKDPITFLDPDFHRKEMTLLASRNATSVDFERVMTAMRQGEVPLEQLVTHRISLEGAIGELPRWAAEKAGLIKALIEIGD